jgi:hypothetical protein
MARRVLRLAIPRGRLLGPQYRDAYASPHQPTVGGLKLSAWCAWDTLFLPQILGKTVEIESTSPSSQSLVRLIVSPHRIERIDPVTTQVSFVLPDVTNIHDNVVTAFCRFVHFFRSRKEAESWAAYDARIFILSVHEASRVARLKNEAQYNQVLDCTALGRVNRVSTARGRSSSRRTTTRSPPRSADISRE